MLSSPKVKKMLAMAADALQDESEAKSDEAAAADTTVATAAASAASASAAAAAPSEISELSVDSSGSELRSVLEDKVLALVNSDVVVASMKKVLQILERPATARFVGTVAKQIEAQGQFDFCVCIYIHIYMSE